MRRQGTRLGIAFALALLLPLTALAGGWAVVTLDRTLAGIEAGKTFEVGFTVLQHGKTPLDGLSPRLNFSREMAARPAGLAKGEMLSFDARPEGKIGHYVASVKLPSEGTWNWQIDAFGEPSKMSALTVAAPAKAQNTVADPKPLAADVTAPQADGAVPAAQTSSAAQPVAIWVLGAAIVLALVGAMIFARRPRRSTARA